MTWSRCVLLTFGAITLIMIALGPRYYCKALSGSAIRRARDGGRQQLKEAERQRLDQHPADLRSFAVAHGYKTKIAFLVDMGLN